jgi:hypothetical protein
MNDWHFVTLTPTETGYKWTNKANVTWTLTLQDDQDLTSDTLRFYVGQDCPYFKQGYDVAELIQKDDETIILGPWNEPYKMVDQTA